MSTDQSREEARWLEGNHPRVEQDRKAAAECAASMEAVVEFGDTACPLCELPADLHRSEEER